MEIVLIALVGGMFSAGIYLLLQKRLAQLIVGLGLLTNATNLLVFTVAGLSRDGAPLIEDGATVLPQATSDPTPQALVLTAIVIGFGVLAFFITLAYRAYREVGSDSLNDMISTDQLAPKDDENVGDAKPLESNSAPGESGGQA